MRLQATTAEVCAASAAALRSLSTSSASGVVVGVEVGAGEAAKCPAAIFTGRDTGVEAE